MHKKRKSPAITSKSKPQPLSRSQRARLGRALEQLRQLLDSDAAHRAQRAAASLN